MPHRGLSLCNLTLMMREYKVHATSVDIKLLTQILSAHRRTFAVPAREAVAPGAGPTHDVFGLGGFPQGEVCLVLFLAYACQFTTGVFGILQRSAREDAVVVFLIVGFDVEIDRPVAFIGEAAGKEIDSYADLREALQKRHDYFAANGCKLSDHGLETFYAADYKELEIELIFKKVLMGIAPGPRELEKFRSAFLHDQAVMDAEAGWTQQFHVGAIRNNNSKMFGLVGPDTGFDAIHDLPTAAAGHKFLDRLASEDKLAKTILYCLNPKDNEVMMTMAYTFNDGTVPGKMQFGSGWWFLDQEDGMRKQMNALSNLGLLSRFVGMLTDSRSFISYPRHEYFRRILCDVVGTDVENGKLPASEIGFLGQMIEDICYNNAKNYFNF